MFARSTKKAEGGGVELKLSNLFTILCHTKRSVLRFPGPGVPPVNANVSVDEQVRRSERVLQRCQLNSFQALLVEEYSHSSNQPS